jgi:hypothetical protein
MNTKILGILGMIGAPFLLLTMFPGSPWLSGKQDTSVQGWFGLIYMLGWMCSIIGLIKLKATGTNQWGKFVLIMELVLLSLANCWNTWNILQIDPHYKLYEILDLTWPLSNVWMLVISITIIINKRLESWLRWVPLVVALWLPMAMAMIVSIGRNSISLLLPGIYSAVAWFLLGYMIWSSPSHVDNKASVLLSRN